MFENIKYCANCSDPNPKQANFCSYCGYSLLPNNIPYARELQDNLKATLEKFNNIVTKQEDVWMSISAKYSGYLDDKDVEKFAEANQEKNRWMTQNISLISVVFKNTTKKHIELALSVYTPLPSYPTHSLNKKLEYLICDGTEEMKRIGLLRDSLVASADNTDIATINIQSCSESTLQVAKNIFAPNKLSSNINY